MWHEGGRREGWSRLLCRVWLVTSSSPGTARPARRVAIPPLLGLCGEWTKQLPLHTDELHGQTDGRKLESSRAGDRLRLMPRLSGRQAT